MSEEQDLKDYQDYLEYQEYLKQQKQVEDKPSKKKEWYEITPEGLSKGIAESLPTAGMIAGGVLGSAIAPPFSTFVGAGLGSGLGKALENLIEETGMYGVPKEEKTLKQRVQEPLAAIPTGVISETGGQLATQAISKGLQKGGEYLYKSGLPEKLSDAAKEILFKLKVLGGKREMSEALQEVVDMETANIQNILREATEKGGEVDMVAAMQPIIAKIRKIRLSKDIQLQPLADELEEQVAGYLKLQGMPAKEIVKSIPGPKKAIPEYTEVSITPPTTGQLGEPILGKVSKVKTYPEQMVAGPQIKYMETIPKVPGPTPLQGYGYAQSVGEGISKRAWQQPRLAKSWEVAEKELERSLRGEALESVSEAIGPMAKEEARQSAARASELIDAIDYLKLGQRAGATGSGPILTPTEIAAGAVDPLAGATVWSMRKLGGNVPSIGIKMSEAGKALAEYPSLTSSLVSAGIQKTVEDPYFRYMTKEKTQTLLNLAGVISQALSQGAPPFVLDKEVQKSPLSPTEKAQLRKQITDEGTN